MLVKLEVRITILKQLEFNAQNFRGDMTMATPIFDKFLGDMFGLPQGTCLSNLKSVSLAVLEQLGPSI